MNKSSPSGGHPRAVAVAFALVATLVLAGCGGSSGSPPPPVTAIAGTASAMGGGALDEYVIITLTPAGGTTPFAAQTNGTYAAAVPAGDYTLSAVRPGYEDYTSPSMVTVTAGQTTTFDFDMVPLAAGTYIGTQSCGVCHTTQLANHLQTGHPYKLNKVEGGVPPTYPFTDISPALALLADDDQDIMGGLADPAMGTDNPAGTPMSWNEITYVIGGYHWKTRFIDTQGWIVTGTQVQYNFVIPGGNLTMPTITSYHNNEDDKAYTCGNCHTTGWKHTDPMDNPVGQDGLAGMRGTFEEGGIRCEACHGAGSTHAQTELAADIVLKAGPRTAADFASPKLGYGAAVACGECHTRDGERDYPTFQSAAQAAGWTGDANWPDMGGRIAAKGGLVRHHEQYDEILGLDPNEDPMNLGTYLVPFSTRTASFAATHGDCATCHTNSHASTVNRNNASYTGPAGVDSSNASCLACHSAATYDPANAFRGTMAGLNCVDCHMPKTSKSATSTTLPNGVTRGDVTSHIFGIDIIGAPPALTSDGKFRLPYLTLDQACRQCHYAGGPGFFDVPTLPMDWEGFHTDKVP
ncbi:MAG: multiheme c-type cytochrome [Planctomycetota bacterium]|nr:multiheme c-type cytochrome [Planctomycetota bacterium]